MTFAHGDAAIVSMVKIQFIMRSNIMYISDRDKELAKKKTRRQWIKTEWKNVEEEANRNNLCYSTWYDRVQSGKSPQHAASYPPCPIKGRKMKGN